METKDIIGLIIISAGLLISLYMIISYAVLRSKGSRKLKTKGKFARKYYNFNSGLKCWQEQLNLEQSEKLAELLNDVELDSNTELTLSMINTALFRKKGLRRFLLIILNADTELSENDFVQLKQDETEAVLNDFFTLNPKMKFYFEILKIAVVSQSKTGAKSMDTDSVKAD